jgi:Mrp family chromosome partitioning ATPase
MVRISARESTILYADADDAKLKLFDAFVSGEVTYLGSRPVMERALAQLSASDMAQKHLPQDVAGLSRMIEVKRSKGLILVAGRSADSTVAATAVNAVIDNYLALHSEQEQGRQNYREQELVAREKELLARLEAIKARSLEVGGEYGINSLLKAHIAKIGRIEELEQRSDELASTIVQLESVGTVSDADTGDMEIKRATLLDRALADMTYDRAKRAATMETLRQRYRPKNPIVVRAERELAVLDKAIEQRREQIATLGRTGALTGTGDGDRTQSTNELKTLQVKLQARLSVLREEAKTLNGKLVELRFLQEERTGIRVLLDETRRVLDQVRVEIRNSLPGVVEVLSRGSLADGAIEDKRPQFAILGAGLGGGLALTLFIGLALLRPVLRYSDDLEGLLSIAPLVATLPRGKAVTEPAFRTSVNRLRNAIQLLPGSEHKLPGRAAIIGVTGLDEGCGATDLCHSLAASFAESGLSTLMVDADLLTPDLTARLEAGEHCGWRDLLSDSNAPAQPIAMEECVALLPAGLAKGVQDTSVSLPRLRAALGELSQDYDLMLFDLGPFRKRLAASLIASQADLTVVVSRPGEPAPQLRRILGQLDRIAPGALCQVFNFASRRDPEIAALIA